MTDSKEMCRTVSEKEIKDAMRLVQESTVSVRTPLLEDEASKLLGRFIGGQFQGRVDAPSLIMASFAIGMVVGYQRGLPKLVVPPS